MKRVGSVPGRDEKERTLRRAMLLIGGVTGLLVMGALFFDEGEVVTLVTEIDGRQYPTHVWIVEVDDRRFVRANRPDARWLARVRANPDVSLLRPGSPHDVSEPYRARVVADARLKARVNAAMARKYRFADRAWGRLADRQRAEVIELQSGGDRAAAAGRGLSSQEKGAGS